MFVVEFSDGSILEFDSLELAKDQIEQCMAENITVEDITEFKSKQAYEDDEDPIAQYGCNWTLTLEKIS